TAAGSVVVFELDRADLDRWLKSHPEFAMDFFAKLVQIQSRRLRRTSSELTLLYDLSQLLLDQALTGKALLSQVVERVTRHMEGAWAAWAYLYNPYNDEMEFIGSCGENGGAADGRKFVKT